MKKILITALLTGLIAGTAFADSNIVSSANIVGYVQTDTPAAGSFNIVSLVQFSNGSNTVHIQDAIGNMDSLNASDTWNNADKLYVWTGMDYDKYGLFQPVTGDCYWSIYNAMVWITKTCVATDAQLNRGEALWYATGAGGTSTNVTASGNVYLDETFDISIPEGFSILAYPYSSDINLTNLVISSATASDVWGTADKIYFFTGSTYEKYGLFQPASGSPYWSTYNAMVWITKTCVPTDKELALGQGFWYESDSAKTIEFSKIYTID